MSYPPYNPYGTPTLRPAEPFNPREDAEILRKAMKGFGTDEKSIINVLAYRTNVQRQEIAVQFKTLYGKDLIKNLKSELSGNFEDLIVAMMMPIPYFLAKEVHDAISGVGTDEETLIEILCTSTNNDIHILCNEYERTFGCSMEEALASDTSGCFRRLLVSICQGNRSENYYVDQAAAQSDAQALLRAGELQLGTDESTFNAILCSRSYPQLRQIFEEYQRVTGHDFTTAIENEFSGDIQAGLLAIVNSVRDRPGYFAERLYNCMKGFGTKDRTLQRIVAVRCEIDMVEIKNSFLAKYGKSLQEFIADDCSGDYKKTLLALVN
ncbi:annexin B9-like isoform X2 [Lycorma delicatula]|uniref:annexin B9-like isoform X2 n=1 Tax=Lycorma delicatula TaxID=130591 RepID=UPI003F51A109